MNAQNKRPCKDCERLKFFHGKSTAEILLLAPLSNFPPSNNQQDIAMSSNLTKRDIILKIYREFDGTVAQNIVRDIVIGTIDALRDAVAAGQSIELRNFGVFEIQVRKERVGRNPNQPEIDVMIPRRAVVKFKAGKELKQSLTQLDLDQFAEDDEDAKPARKPARKPAAKAKAPAKAKAAAKAPAKAGKSSKGR